MSIPTGYEKLAVIGIAWKGEYAQGTVYKTMNGVYYKGSTYVALRDNPTGPPVADGANWQYLAKGFEQQLLSAVTALDTSGVLGQAGASVGGQALMDAIADKVMTKLVERSAIVQTESTSTDKVPSSAYFKQVTDRVISDLASKASNNDVNTISSKIASCYKNAVLLCQEKSGTITLSDSIYNYKLLRFENNNFGFTTFPISDAGSNIVRVSTISMSGSIMVLCCGAWNVTNSGKTLTPSYMVQVNIDNSKAITLFDTGAALTWNIVGYNQ